MKSAVSACALILLLLAASLECAAAFQINRREISYAVKRGPSSDGYLQYQDDSNALDLREGEFLTGHASVDASSPPAFEKLSESRGFGMEDEVSSSSFTTAATCGNPPSHQRRSVDRRYSAADWLYNLSTWRNSSVLRDIRNPVMALTSWATLVSLLHKLFLTTGRNNWALRMSIPHSAHSFLVSSIGLLLVFRTNSAYQRFLEGRKIWEQVLSQSRNLSRFITVYRNEVGKDRRRRILHLLASFPYLLHHQVRNGCLCADDCTHIDEAHKVRLREPSRPQQFCFVDRRKFPWSLLEKAQRDGPQNILQKIAQVTNRPLWICDRLSKEVMGIPIGPNFSSRERLKLLADVDKLANAIGSCERIHQTAVPLHYARHALRSLTMWIVTLPFSLVKDFGLMTGPVTAIVAWLLFGVYQIGHSIEDPFQGSIRLSNLCEDIRMDVLSSDDFRESAFEPVPEIQDLELPQLDLQSHKLVDSIPFPVTGATASPSRTDAVRL